MLLNGDTISLRVAEEIATRFNVDLAWLIGLTPPDGTARH